jgi:hypothetical protein
VLTTVPRALRRMVDVAGISAGVARQRVVACKNRNVLGWCPVCASILLGCPPTVEPRYFYSGSELFPSHN